MLLDGLHQMPDALAGMIAGALLVDIAEGPLNRIGPGAVDRQIEHLEAGMRRQPLLDLRGSVNLGIVDPYVEVEERPRRVRSIQGLEEVQEEPRDFTIPDTGGEGPFQG
jgi:hypothetical protein